MKLNNKGFVATTTLYSCFILLITIILLILRILDSQNQNIRFGSEEVKKRINQIIPYDVKLDD